MEPDDDAPACTFVHLELRDVPYRSRYLVFLHLDQYTSTSRATSGFNRQHSVDESNKKLHYHSSFDVRLPSRFPRFLGEWWVLSPSKQPITHLDKVRCLHHMHSSQERFPSCSLEVPQGSGLGALGSGPDQPSAASTLESTYSIKYISSSSRLPGVNQEW